MFCYQFKFPKNHLITNVEETLHQVGLKDLFTIEEELELLVCGFSDTPLSSLPFPGKLIPTEIDWTEQTKLHSEFFDGELIKVPLQAFGGIEKELFLLPGAGFGDLSHPTTKICLEIFFDALNSGVIRKTYSALDLGCGNGVLTLASMQSGIHCIGVDIDPCALDLAKRNAKLNQIKAPCFFYPEDKITYTNELLFCNMIFSEQKNAFSSLLFKETDLCIASGILQERQEEYLAWLETLWEFKVLKSVSKDEWIGFLLKKK